LLPFPLPGGEAAVRHPNRAAFGLLYRLVGEDVLLRDPRWTRHLGLSQSDARMLASMIRRRVNTPWTSSVGRLFDAVAAILLGVCEVTYEGEAAVLLEAVADARVTDAYDLPIRASEDHPPKTGASCCALGDWRPLLSELLTDLDRDTDVGIIAGRFHNSLARWAHDLVAQQPHLDVILSGGCFQNKLLTERTMHELGKLNRSIYLPRQIPIGDGGLAAGQLAVALAVNRRDHG